MAEIDACEDTRSRNQARQPSADQVRAGRVGLLNPRLADGNSRRRSRGDHARLTASGSSDDGDRIPDQVVWELSGDVLKCLQAAATGGARNAVRDEIDRIRRRVRRRRPRRGEGDGIARIAGNRSDLDHAGVVGQEDPEASQIRLEIRIGIDERRRGQARQRSSCSTAEHEA